VLTGRQPEAARVAAPDRRPILVTGMPRSGTTWVSRMLAAGGGVVVVNEPLNPRHPPGRSPGILRASVRYRFQYIHPGNESEFLGAYEDLLRLRFRLATELRANHAPRDFPRALHYAFAFRRGRLQRRRVLIADPYAVFSVPWFVDRLGAQVVAVVRNPAATVSSRKRLGWQIDLRQLLDQPALVRDHLGGIAPELEAQLERPDDIIGQGALLWRAIYGAVAKFAADPAVVVVRHEDLSLRPREEFARLYDALRLPFTSAAEERIAESTSAENRPELSVSRPHATKLDSRANLDNWRRRLSEEEIDRIRVLTRAVAGEFYGGDAASAAPAAPAESGPAGDGGLRPA
jgi:hypothetical protein